MQEKNIKQVSPACSELYRTGLAALERQEPNAAIPDFLLALDLEPGFYDCREALRRAVQSASSQQPGLFKTFVHQLRISSQLSEAQFLVHLKPLKAISIAERVLAHDPTNTTAHKLLAKAALLAGFPRTALLSLQSLPTTEHRALELELAEALSRSGNASGAAVVYGRILKKNPEDRTVLRALRHYSDHASAAQVAEQRNGAASPVPAPTRPARQFIPPKPAENDDAIIRRYEGLLAHCPRNIKVIETLAEAYARKNMFDKALVCHQRALKISGGKNEAVKKAIVETTMKEYDAALAKLDPKAPDYAARREELQNKRLEFHWVTMDWPA